MTVDSKVPKYDFSLHVCSLCDFIYADDKGAPSLGIPGGTKFEDLPEDFAHPGCRGTKELFETCTCAELK